MYNTKKKISYQYCKKIYYFSEKIFCNKIKNNIKLLKEKNFLIGPAFGEIYKKDLIKNLSLLHCHPGKLPEFKGSCTIYYSILEKSNIYATVFEINDKIDKGRIFYNKKYQIPNFQKTKYDDFDYEIRAKTFISFLKKKEERIQKL